MKVWRTDDLSLAAYLAYELGEDPSMEWEQGSCLFVFTDSGDIGPAVQAYISGDATVEPREYNLEHGKLKKAMFSHPDSPSRRKPITS